MPRGFGNGNSPIRELILWGTRLALCEQRVTSERSARVVHQPGAERIADSGCGWMGCVGAGFFETCHRELRAAKAEQTVGCCFRCWR